jgi:hypothetical protein
MSFYILLNPLLVFLSKRPFESFIKIRRNTLVGNAFVVNNFFHCHCSFCNPSYGNYQTVPLVSWQLKTLAHWGLFWGNQIFVILLFASIRWIAITCSYKYICFIVCYRFYRRVSRVLHEQYLVTRLSRKYMSSCRNPLNAILELGN